MRSIPPKILLWIWLGAGIVVTGIFVWLIIGFWGNKLSANAKTIDDALLTIELNRREAQNISTLQKQVAEIQSNAAKLDGAFVSRLEAIKLVEILEQLATKYNLEEDFKPVEPLRNPTLRGGTFLVEERNFQLSVTGATTNILQFLRDIEIKPAYLLINQFSIVQSEDKTATMTIDGTIPWH